MSSSDLVDEFKGLSLSSSNITATLNKKPLNVRVNLNEFAAFDFSKYSSRILLNYKDMSLMGLKAGSLVRIQCEDSIIRNIFEVWPSILTKCNDVTFGSVYIFSWINFESGAKINLLPVDLITKPILTAKMININYHSSECSDYRDLIFLWFKRNYFSSKCISFVLFEDKEIIFDLEVSNGVPGFVYRFEQNETVLQENSSLQKTAAFKIGGIESQYNEIFNIANTFFKTGNNSNSFQIKVPHGVLLHGPPGCGKTMLVKIVSESMKLPVIHLTASDFSSAGFGEAETRLKNIFSSAKNLSPCIIFMDEVDSLCPKRDNHSSASSQRITTLLLTLMDGCSDEKSSSKIFFIGATNIPSSLDPAMRRPGRFDREIEISPPSTKDRYNILTNILANYPNCLTTEDVISVSEISHGYVGSDLNLLCKESYLNSIKENAGLSESPKINFNNIRETLSKIRPSAMREVFVEVPKVKWADIGGQKNTKQKLIECVEWPIKFPDRFERLGIKPPKGILLFGPPGCSKTLLAKALASESGLNFLAVKGPEVFSKFIGESEKKIREIFKKARQASPSIIFFDEFDSIAGRSGSGDGTSSVSNRVMSQLLNEMDGLEPLVNVVIIAATNKPDLIDKALLRPGRFDRHIYISLPDFEGRLEIFKILMNRMPFDDDFVPEKLADITEGFSGAEITSLCQNAAIKSLERDISSQKIEWEDFETCLTKFDRQINPESLKIFEKFIE